MNTATNQHTNAMLDSQQHDVFLWKVVVAMVIVINSVIVGFK